MPRGYVIYNPLHVLLSLVYYTPMTTIGIALGLYISAWGFSVARFDLQALPTASECEASDNARASRFFYASAIHVKHSGIVALATINRQNLGYEHQIFQQHTWQYPF